MRKCENAKNAIAVTFTGHFPRKSSVELARGNHTASPFRLLALSWTGTGHTLCPTWPYPHMASDDTDQPKNSNRIEALWIVSIQPFIQKHRFLLAFGIVLTVLFVFTTKWNSAGTISIIIPHETIYLNVGGMIFTTSRKTIFSKGTNQLTSLIEESSKEFPVFIDRNPILFNAILEYLRTGRYFLPPQVSGWPQLINEIEYYGLPSPAEASKSLRPTATALNALAAYQAEMFLNRTSRNIASALKDAVQKAIPLEIRILDTAWQNAFGTPPTPPHFYIQVPFTVTHIFGLRLQRLLSDSIPGFTTDLGTCRNNVAIYGVQGARCDIVIRPVLEMSEFPLPDPNVPKNNRNDWDEF